MIWNEQNLLLSFIANNNIWCLTGILFRLFLCLLIDCLNFLVKAFWSSFTRRGLHADTNWMCIMSSTLSFLSTRNWLQTQTYEITSHGGTRAFSVPKTCFHKYRKAPFAYLGVFIPVPYIFGTLFCPFPKPGSAKWDNNLFGSAFGFLKVSPTLNKSRFPRIYI